MAASNLLFSSFGVAEMIRGGPGGALAGALLITGAIVNAVTTTASSRELFLAGLIPQIVCFAFLPGVALGHGAGRADGLAARLRRHAQTSSPRRWPGGCSPAVLAGEDRARAEAEAANNAKSEFLANMSHEIRTPLNGVLAMAQIIALGDLVAGPARAGRCDPPLGRGPAAVLNDILDLSKIEAGKMEIDAGEVDAEAWAATCTPPSPRSPRPSPASASC